MMRRFALLATALAALGALVATALAQGWPLPYSVATGVSLGAIGSVHPSDPGGTTATGGVMMGLGSSATITPKTTGRMLIIVSGTFANNTINDGAGVDLRTGTGTAPVNGAALTGNLCTGGAVNRFVVAAANQQAPGSIQCTVTGLALGTPIWIDVGLYAITAGTALFQNVVVTAVEL